MNQTWKTTNCKNLKKKSEEKYYINVNEKGKLEYYPQQEID